MDLPVLVSDTLVPLVSTCSSSSSAMVRIFDMMVWRHYSGHQCTNYNTVTPILGAIVADQYLGKYNTILVFAVIYWVVSSH